MDVHPWLVMGDFNVIREDMKRTSGNHPPISTMEEFNSCLDNCGLMEVAFQGHSLSWCNG